MEIHGAEGRMMNARVDKLVRDAMVWTHLAAAATFAGALYMVWMLGHLVATPADRIRKLTRGQLLREAMSGNPPPSRDLATV